jgi:hypothetical protein
LLFKKNEVFPGYRRIIPDGHSHSLNWVLFLKGLILKQGSCFPVRSNRSSRFSMPLSNHAMRLESVGKTQKSIKT